MLGWALIINNLGRRRYPVYWVKSDGVFLLISKGIQARRERREEIKRQNKELGNKNEEVRVEHVRI
jgi:hypothetical protein